jgi:tRNA nucleotidyltransferase (CCA-adding enzyme)
VSAGLRELEDRSAALQLQASAPQPILLGRHLIELGLRPGPQFGEILAAAFDAQLEGEFFDLGHALGWLAGRTDFTLPPEAVARLRARSSTS